MDYQYQFEKCRDLDTWYKAWRMERSSARAWIQYMNGLMMACSCCPHGTASLRNKRTNPNLLCLSRLHVALPIPHATSEVLRTRPRSDVLLLSANCRYTHPLIRDADGYCLLCLYPLSNRGSPIRRQPRASLRSGNSKSVSGQVGKQTSQCKG